MILRSSSWPFFPLIIYCLGIHHSTSPKTKTTFQQTAILTYTNSQLPSLTMATLSIESKRSSSSSSICVDDIAATPPTKIQKLSYCCPPTPRGKRALTKTFFENDTMSLSELFLPGLSLTDDASTNNNTTSRTKFQLKPRFSDPAAEVFLPNFLQLQGELQHKRAQNAVAMPSHLEADDKKTRTATTFRAKLPKLSGSHKSGSEYARCA